MKTAIMQPTYIPWLGYFDLIDQVDVFVFYDDIQLTKRSWQVRNKLKGPNGEIWLTIPIMKTKSRNDLLIKDALINNNEKWFEKHLKSIEFNYKKSQYFADVYDLITSFYSNKYEFVADFNINIITNIAHKIGITTKFIKSSALNGITGQKDERLVNICNNINAETYISPVGSATYINQYKKGGKFVDNEIKLWYHNYEHPEYKQLYGNFIPFIGIFDLLFNEGFENALNIIKSGRRKPINYINLK